MPGKPADELQHNAPDRCAEPSGKLQREPQQFVVRPFVETVEAEREPALYQFQIDALGKEIIHNLVEADNVLPRMWRPPALWKRQADSQQGGIVGCRTVQVVEGFPCGHIGVRAFFRTFRIIVGSDGKKSSRQKIITLAGGGSSLFFLCLTPRLMSVADSASLMIQRASSRTCCSDNCLHVFSFFAFSLTFMFLYPFVPTVVLNS